MARQLGPRSRLPKDLPNRSVLLEALKEYRECATYWYVPKARALNEENVGFLAQLLAVLAEHFEGSKWDHATQSRLLEVVTKEGIMASRVAGGSSQDRNALLRINKVLMEALGLIWIFENRELVITDVGELLIAAANVDEQKGLIQNQIAKFQYPNPVINTRLRREFSGIVPLLFILDVLRLVGNSISVIEFELFMNLAISHADVERIAGYIDAWRSIGEAAQAEALPVFQASEMMSVTGRQLTLGTPAQVMTNAPTRWARIHLNAAYQLSFYCYPDLLDREGDRGPIVCASPVEANEFLSEQLEDLQVTQFLSRDDWFAYMGDPNAHPTWLSHLEYEIAKSKTLEDVRQVAERLRATLSHEDSARVQRLQREKEIELKYVNQPEQLQKIEPGLVLRGNQVKTPIGDMDLLCKDADDSYVVIEIKVGPAEDAVFGQIQRYMGWIHSHYEDGRDNVRGIVLAGEFPEKARYSRIGLLKPDAEEFLKFERHRFRFEEE